MGMETDERHIIHEEDKQNGKLYTNNDNIMAASTSSSSLINQTNNDDYNKYNRYPLSVQHVHFSDDFEKSIEESMDDLEYIDSKNDIDILDDPLIDWKEKYVKIKENRERTTSSSTDTSYGDDGDIDSQISPTNNILQQDGTSSNPFRNPEAIQQKILFWRPLLIPYQERRRLSECKEEDETIIEETLDNKYQIIQSKHQQQPNTPSTIAQITGTKHKFIVTKTKDDISSPRPEAEQLRHMTAKQNAATIHFPCSSNNVNSSSLHRPSLNSLFFSSDKQQFSPHLDKRYFDTSLIEIRAINSTNSLNNNQSLNNGNDTVIVDDMVWLPRTKIDSDYHEKKIVSLFYFLYCYYYFFN